MKTLHLLLILVISAQLSHAQTRVELKQTHSERRHQIVCVAYSPDSKLIASGGFDNQIIVRNSQTGAVVQRLTGLKGFPLSLTFSHDSRFLISGGKDSRVTIWDLSSGKSLREIRAHRDDVTDVAINASNIIASASKDKTVKIWDFNGVMVKELTGHKREVMAVDFSHDGQRIVSGSADGTVKEWDVLKGAETLSINAHDGWVRTVAYNHNSTLIASGGDDGKINIWNRSNGQRQNTIIAHSKWLENLSFSPDGKYIASGGHDNYLIIVNANTGQIVFNSPKQDYYVLSTAFDPSGKNLISSVLNSADLSVWDVSSLGIGEAVPVSIQPKTKPTITWITTKNQQTDNLTHRVNAKIKTDSPLSSVEVYLNNNRFASHRDITFDKISNSVDFEQILFLNEGNNEIKLIAYNDGGEATSEVLSVTYMAPKPESIVEVIKEEIQPVAEKVEAVKIEAKQVEAKEEIKVEEKIEEKVQKPVVSAKTYQKVKPNPYRFALIIGNEDYSTYQTGLERESNVAFAINDATAFKEVAQNVLGVPSDNIIFLTNARAIEMDDAVRKLNPIIKALNGKAEIFFYYAGHGFPDEKTKEPYLIPVDVSGTNLRFAVSLKELYQQLTEHPSARVTVFLDACFSGGAREQGLVAARAVRVRPREDRLQGNLVVFTASSGNESAHPYKEKEHGIFTFHLLEKIKDTGGELSYRELSEYLSEQVGVRSVMVNNMPQTPQTNVSFDVEGLWGDWKLK
ncbi:MAG: caspase family protein [Tenuifilaceae bacterium]|jgi:WD40 repeat protein|nr:caspase family protein [Tenuifilaceae bacterium]